MRKIFATVCITLLALPVGAPAQVRINEIRVDDSGTPQAEDGNEFFELAGPPGTSLAGLSYLVIGDGAGGFGTVEFVFTAPFNSQSIAANGVLAFQIIRDVSGPFPECPCTGGCAPFLYFPLAFENNDNVTHMLVRNFTGASDDDLDTDDDGTLDVTPWGEIVDSVALLDTATGGDPVYSSTLVGPDPVEGQPWHVYFCLGPGWQIGTADPSCVSDTIGEQNGCDATSVEEPEIDSWGGVKSRYR